MCSAARKPLTAASDSKRKLVQPQRRAATQAEAKAVEIDAAGASLSVAAKAATTDKGNVEVGVIDRRLREISRAWANAPALQVVPSFEDLPAVVQQGAYKQGADASSNEGVYDHRTNSVYIVASNITDLAHAETVYLHEVLGHYGLNQIAGQTAGERNKFKLDLFHCMVALGFQAHSVPSELTDDGRIRVGRSRSIHSRPKQPNALIHAQHN